MTQLPYRSVSCIQYQPLEFDQRMSRYKREDRHPIALPANIFDIILEKWGLVLCVFIRHYWWTRLAQNKHSPILKYIAYKCIGGPHAPSGWLQCTEKN